MHTVSDDRGETENERGGLRNVTRKELLFWHTSVLLRIRLLSEVSACRKDPERMTRECVYARTSEHALTADWTRLNLGSFHQSTVMASLAVALGASAVSPADATPQLHFNHKEEMRENVHTQQERWFLRKRRRTSHSGTTRKSSDGTASSSDSSSTRSSSTSSTSSSTSSHGTKHRVQDHRRRVHPHRRVHPPLESQVVVATRMTTNLRAPKAKKARTTETRRLSLVKKL